MLHIEEGEAHSDYSEAFLFGRSDMIEFTRTHIIGRSAGHSSVKAAAYRSGIHQYDERNASKTAKPDTAALVVS